MNKENQFFKKAKPVWLEGREREKNVTAGFVCGFAATDEDRENFVVSITASSIYRVFVNGIFVGHGPARAAHGCYRVDVIKIPGKMLQEENVLAVEVAGFYVNSFYTLEQPSFLQAEVVREESTRQQGTCSNRAILCYTGKEGSFYGREISERLGKVQRYSFQRPFIEVYSVDEEYGRWRTQLWEKRESLQELQEGRLLLRNVPWPEFQKHMGDTITAEGSFVSGCMDQEIWQDRALFEIGDTLHGFKPEELEEQVSVLLDRTRTLAVRPGLGENGKSIGAEGWAGEKGEFVIIDLMKNLTGFLGVSLECSADAHGMLVFDEVLTEGDVKYNRMSCVNGISFHLKKGSYEIETIQPYTCRYLKFMVWEGRIKVKETYLRDYQNPSAQNAAFTCDNPAINRIFEAGRETYAQNATDIYMDCPSRERAGWLCDSFFTGRVERLLTGKSLVEENFLENYMLPEAFEDIPQGMVPMCYPSDHRDGMFIANWALWLILELYEYRDRGRIQGDESRNALIDGLEKRVDGILAYFADLENEFGLVENMPGWVFVEWSKANELTEGVNFPSNMLYSAALSAAGILYGKEEYSARGQRVRREAARLSYDGEWFCDQALRIDGKLVRQKEATEVCQYYAFYFKAASRESYPALHKKLMEDFGPDREAAGRHPKIWPANAFIGNYLRMELLSQDGRAEQLLQESVEFFDYMALRTGTLWENTGAYASCNHGFASHIIQCFYRDILGVRKIAGREIELCLPSVELSFCRGRIPVEGGSVEIEWEKTKNGLDAHIKLPKGFRAVISSQDTSIMLQATFVYL